MPSILRNSFTPNSTNTPTLIRTPPPSPPQKKQKMSLTQTYYLAHTARGKLSKEAARADHNLRRLVGHANLLDNLMLDLADAERAQENWFNQTVTGATKASQGPKHIQWADTIEEAVEDEDEYADSSDSDSDSDDEVEYAQHISVRRMPQQPTPITTEDEDEDMEDDEEYDEELALTRTSSEHPPELLHESDSDTDDDMPPSPPQAEIPLDAFSEKQRQAIATTGYYGQKAEGDMPSDQASFFDEGFYIPPRQQAPVISAF